MNNAYVTELGNFIADSRIDYWIYGHSHANIDAEINSTKDKSTWISIGWNACRGIQQKSIYRVIKN